MSQRTKKNHYVPELYLKQWAENQEVRTYRTLVSHAKVPIWESKTLAAIGYQKHLYTQIVSGKESDYFEQWLNMEVESPAAKPISKVIFDQKLSPKDWYILIRFLAAQDVRTPARLTEHIERTQRVLDETLHSVLLEIKEDKVPKDKIGKLNAGKTNPGTELFPLKITTEKEEGSENGKLTAETYAGRSTWLFSIKHLIENTSKALHRHKWTIIKPAKGYTWFTSDNPVVKINYYGRHSYDLKGGWDKDGSIIILPLGPNHAMFVQVGSKPPLKGARLSESKTIEIRNFIAQNAHRQIFSSFEDDDIPALRQRTINSEQARMEKEHPAKWHEENSKLEREFTKNRTLSNKPQ